MPMLGLRVEKHHSRRRLPQLPIDEAVKNLCVGRIEEVINQRGCELKERQQAR